MRTKITSLLLLAAGTVCSGQSMTSTYSGSYSLTDLHSITGVPTNYGALTFEAGNSNTLLIGGGADTGTGAIYAVSLTRGAGGHITGFSGSATSFSLAANIDGGLDYAPNGSTLLYTGYQTDVLGQILPGHTSPSVVTSLNSIGIGTPGSDSTGSFAFVPSEFPGGGNLLIASYDSANLYKVPYTLQGNGTYSFSAATLLNNYGSVGFEGLAYVKGGNPDFASDTVLVADYNGNQTLAYTLDSNGAPTGTAKVFVTGLTGAVGAAVDPVTGDFLFSTFGASNQVFVVSGFTIPIPEPAFYAAGMGILGLGAVCMKRRTG